MVLRDQTRIAKWKLVGTFLAGGALIPLPGTLLLLTLYLSKPSDLGPLHRLHNGLISAVSGCSVVDDGRLTIIDGLGHWSTWEKGPIDGNGGRADADNHPEQSQNEEDSGERIVAAKLLQGCP